jgi:hypothetical protein
LKKKIRLVEKGPLDLVDDCEREVLTGLCASAYAEREKRGLVPAGVDISAPGSRKKVKRWPRFELEAWVREQIALRDRELAAAREQERQDRVLLERDPELVADQALVVADRERIVADRERLGRARAGHVQVRRLAAGLTEPATSTD